MMVPQSKQSSCKCESHSKSVPLLFTIKQFPFSLTFIMKWRKISASCFPINLYFHDAHIFQSIIEIYHIPVHKRKQNNSILKCTNQQLFHAAKEKECQENWANTSMLTKRWIITCKKFLF